MFERNIPSHLQNVAKYRVYEIRKIGGLRHYQRGGNLIEGEVNFERGGSDPLGNYAPSLDAVNCVSFELVLMWFKVVLR